MSKEEGTNFIAAFRQNNTALIEAARKTLQPRMVAYLTRYKHLIKGNIFDEAEEWVAEGINTFWELCQNPDFTLTGSHLAYLWVTCKNKWLDHLRRKKNFLTLPIDSLPNLETIEQTDNQIKLELPNIIDDLQQKVLETINNKLSLNCKQLFYWRYVDHKNFKTIAQKLNTSETAARQRFFNCKLNMEKIFPENIQQVIANITPTTLAELLSATKFLDDWASEFSI
ncbi:MAG: sigma-70 family RNA polymerase sigma factor [Sphingobacteriales bacterium]|jgi:RNA polymerase sigma factor (sigma-70 family)|nr:sigma-70 family RNA polymerase sigma factor [Sphingobacteriales bacterium]MBP9141545.1 sigma-70 family RNA polymerase sigma factor [Chitinophagales bacterium]MDA0198382.1 sigma-70 family RNA polymerase sigma factor [Bacteroidota bacterium]MBK6891072.1 sigma-70 family RNA polymerase sigma factor [Sphingobacteriales bacterium]MBK7527101.1 sigma-70 family RNA polymerase sigma factor [Sphingobacteriales bacterium]